MRTGDAREGAELDAGGRCGGAVNVVWNEGEARG